LIRVRANASAFARGSGVTSSRPAFAAATARRVGDPPSPWLRRDKLADLPTSRRRGFRRQAWRFDRLTRRSSTSRVKSSTIRWRVLRDLGIVSGHRRPTFHGLVPACLRERATERRSLPRCTSATRV